MKTKVFKVPSQVLRQKCDTAEFGAKTRFLGQKLLLVLDNNANAVGVAANQIGVTSRVFAYDFSKIGGKGFSTGDFPTKGFVVNPSYTSDQETTTTELEGCLSVPGNVLVERLETINAFWFDSTGLPYEATLVGMPARVFQHEVDHLDGILMTDHVSE